MNSIPPSESDRESAVLPFDLSSLTFGTAWAKDPHGESAGEGQRNKRSQGAQTRNRGRQERDGSKNFRPSRQNQEGRRENQRFSRGDGPDFKRGFRNNFHDRQRNRSDGREFPPADFTITFYPDDEAFQPITELIKKSGKTYEAFRVAKSFLSSDDRFVFVLKKNPNAGKFYFCAFDDVPFTSRDGVIDHLLQKHLDKIFNSQTRTIDPPRGTFNLVHRCPFTKKLLSAPNYHRYHEILRDHHERFVKRLSFLEYCSKLESTREPEDIQQWINEMSQQTVYIPRDKEKSDDENSEKKPEEQTSNEAAETENALTTTAQIRSYIIEKRPDLVREAANLRVKGSSIQAISEPTLRGQILYQLQLQRKFPLETASAMRNKLKNAGLYVYKRGKKGVTFVCATRRKFRNQQTEFAPELQKILTLLEEKPQITVHQLCEAFPETKETALASLNWLIREGYVSEFENGTLLTYSPLPQKRSEQNKKSEKNQPQQEELEDAAPVVQQGTLDLGKLPEEAMPKESSEEESSVTENVNENPLQVELFSAVEDAEEKKPDEQTGVELTVEDEQNPTDEREQNS